MIEKIIDNIKLQETKLDLGFYPRNFTGLSLPIYKPKTRFYEISNGEFLMYLESGSWINPKTRKIRTLRIALWNIPPPYSYIYLPRIS